MQKLNALFLVATLKKSPDLSNTLILSEFMAKYLEKYDTKCDIIRLADYNIEPGTYTNIDNDDEWVSIFEKILVADIIIFATPIWWGVQSSLMQRVIERLDELHDEFMDTGKSRLTNKVAGIIVTGDSEGAEHIIGNLTNYFTALGFTTPPFSTLTVLWSGLAKISDKTKQEILDYFEENYASTAKKAGEILTFMGNLLKKNPLPE